MKLRMPIRAWGAEAAEIVAGNNDARLAVDALAKHLANKKRVREPRIWEFGDFDDRTTKAIWTVAYKHTKVRGGFPEHLFIQEMDKTTPVVAKARFLDNLIDLWRLLAQPEFLRLWGGWNSRTGSRGRDPGYFAKALLVIMAVIGKSAHFDDNVKELKAGEYGKYRVVFNWIEENAAALVGRRPQRFGAKCYERALTQVALLVDLGRNAGALTTDGMIFVNVGLLKTLSLDHPSVCRLLGIDGMLVKAWVKQVGTQKTHEKEMRLRRRAVNATGIKIDGKKGAFGRFVRGYWLFVLVDLATNLPVVWGLFPATKGRPAEDGEVPPEARIERRALRYLLNALFEVWGPDCPTEAIVGDRAWDIEEAVKDCAVRFGIHLIVDRDDPSWERKPTLLNVADYPTIDRFDGRGVAYCRHHPKTPMIRESSRFVGRDQRDKRGLEPGVAVSDKAFTLRLTCPIGGPDCGQLVDLPMKLDWTALAYHPHTMEGGRERLYAFRLAMYARRNSCEALFGALKLGQSLGLDGADRTHTDNEPTVETLLSLALLFRTGLVVAAERIKSGVMAADPPPALLRELQPPPD
jgi:hypothetical protein